MLNRRSVTLAVLMAMGACKGKTDESSAGTADAQDGEAKAPTAEAKAATVETPPPQTKTPPRGKQLPPPPHVEGPPPEAKRTESGIAYLVLEPGEGDARAGADDKVKVEYTGWTTDGTTFDTTDGRPPRSFKLTGVIKGWQEAIPRMAKGEKTRFWIPEELAYKGRKHAPQGMLVFEIKLVDILQAPPAPEDVASAPADTKKTAGGVAYKVLTPGTGDKHPRKWDRVKVHYSGWTTDGKMFDSSVMKERPSSFELNRVIPGWTEGIATMVVGEKTRFWIPKELAYDDKPGRPQGMLVFDVELLEIEELPEPPPPPETPKDVAAPPKDAKKTDSGLTYKVLTKGKGDQHPEVKSRVKVHYSGWTTDGKMFDSSVTRGQPAEFPLSGVIKGWTEGVQLMVPGEKTRFWIPKELAYNDAPGKPQGMLVFDIELLEIL